MSPPDKIQADITIDPPSAQAGQLGCWKLGIKLVAGCLDQGAVVFFIPQQKAAKLWPLSQFTDPWGINYTTVSTDAAASLELIPPRKGLLKGAQKYAIGARVAQGSIQAGQCVTFTFGDTSAGSPGMRMLATAHDFKLSVALSGQDQLVYLDHAPIFRLCPAHPAALKAIAPSIVDRDKEHTLRVQLVDAFGNLCQAGDAIEIAPMPGATLAPLPSPDGVGRAQFRLGSALAGDQAAFHARYGAIETLSNPCRLRKDASAPGLYWGDMHGHSDLGQGLESPQFVYAYARDVEGLDFLAHVEHDAAGDIDLWVGDEFKSYRPGMTDIRDYINETWQVRKGLVRQHYQPGKFVTFLGYEWASNIYGHMNVIYRADEAPIFCPDEFWQKDFDPDRLWQLLEPYPAITIPHHCSTVSNWRYASGMNWNYYHPRFMRAVEIYSKWGCSETMGCARPTTHQVPGSATIEGLKRGYRFGFVGGSDSHASRPGGDSIECGWDGIYRQSGLAAVYAGELTREAIFDAITRRHCYATTGVRIIVDFQLNGQPMGSEITVDSPSAPREIYYDIAGTAALECVEIVKNGSVMYRYIGRAEDSADASFTVPDHQDVSPEGDFYYLRVTQKDGSMAWASPVWVAAR